MVEGARPNSRIDALTQLSALLGRDTPETWSVVPVDMMHTVRRHRAMPYLKFHVGLERDISSVSGSSDFAADHTEPSWRP